MANRSPAKVMARFARIVNLAHKSHRMEVRATMPAQDISMFDKDGHPMPWLFTHRLNHVLHLLSVQNTDFFTQLPSIKSGRSVFVAGAFTSVFSPAFYTDIALNYPMEGTVSPCAMGKSTICLARQLRSLNAPKKTLLDERFVLIHMDKTTMKNIKFQDDFVAKHKDTFTDTVPRITSPEKPSGGVALFHCKRQAVRSDLDHLDHVSQGHYTKFCLDAASLFFKGQRQSNPLLVRRIECVMKAEVLEGDVMDIYVWKSREDVMHFQLEVESHVKCNATIEFYPQEIASKL